MRMWEIREGYEHDGYRKGRSGKMGMRHEKTVEEAYERGYEDGYEAAIEEMEGKAQHRMGQRSRMY
jgi:flagellar biosynthesis/type III secretory pathway protein FliH